MDDIVSFKVVDCNQRGQRTRAAIIGSTFSGRLFPCDDNRFHRMRMRTRMRHRGLDPDALGDTWYYGHASMLQGKNGRVKPSIWQNIFFQWVFVELLPDDKYEVD